MKKTAIFLAFCLIFMCMHNNVETEAKEYINTVRVGISYASLGEGWFSSEGSISITDANYMSYITSIPANTSFKIVAENGGLTSEYFSHTTASVRLESVSPITFGGKKYRGAFEVRNINNKVTVINIVSMEDYLSSVLGKEMNSLWPIEALKAQAVCARNYVISAPDKHASYGFDVCATTDCQVYAGMASEADRTRRAVKETSGVTVTYQGEEVPLYYFSCDGGYTESSENVWSKAEGYLRGKKDIYENPEYATLYNWTKTLKKSEIEDVLNSKNLSVGELLDIRVDKVTENNGVIELTFVGTERTRTVKKTQTRTILSLNSQAYTIEKKAYSVPTRTETEVVTQNVLTSEGVSVVTNPQYTLTSEGLIPIHYDTIQVPVDATSYDEYIFTGHGWGHLVGMSQWGAYSMAQEGYTYKDILSFYYTDIEIVENDIPENAEEANTETTEDYNTQTEEDTSVEENEDIYTEEAEEWETDDETQWSDTGI